MTKKLLLILLFYGLYAAAAIAQSPPVDNLYKIALNGDDVTPDGDLADWQDAQWVYLSVDRPAYNILEPSSDPGMHPSSPNDGSGWFAMKMDDDNVYFAVRVRDENAPLLNEDDIAENLLNYDHLNIFLGLYDIGSDMYRSPHEEVLDENSGFNLIDPENASEIFTGSSYRISPADDNTGTTLGPDHQIAVRAINYSSSDEPVTYSYGYVQQPLSSTEVGVDLWDDDDGYNLEWKVPFSALAGEIADPSGPYADFDWPQFSPQDGQYIPFDATIGDADEVTDNGTDIKLLPMGLEGNREQLANHFGWRGEIVDMTQSPNNTPRWTYAIDYKDEQEITIDADLSDWYDAHFMGISHDIPNWVEIQGVPGSAADLSGYLAVKADNENIYFGLRVRDEGTPMIETLDTPNLAFNYDHLGVYLGLYEISDVPSNPHVEGPGEFEMYNFKWQDTDSARVDTIEATRTYRIRPENDNTETTRGADHQLILRALPYGTSPVVPEHWSGAYVDTTVFKGNEAAGVVLPDETGYVMEWKIPFESLAGEINSRVNRQEFNGIEWPLFEPSDGTTISFDADLTDRDETDGTRNLNRFLRLGDQPALWRDSKSFKMRGAITATTKKMPVSVEQQDGNLDEIPSIPQLAQNYPNPFNPVTTIEYSLPEANSITLRVFNVVGQEVAVLDSGQRSAGTHRITFDASNLSSGVYLYRLEASNSSIITRKLTLIK